jgi:hypothetical protein
LVVVAEGEHHVLDEVVAVIEALLLQQVAARTVCFDVQKVVGTHQLLDLAL